MKRRIRLIAGIVLAVAMMTGMLTGCAENVRAAVQVGDEKVSEEEAKLYLYTAQYETEEQNQMDIAYSYGDPMTYWNSEYIYTTLAELTKNFTMEQIIQTKALAAYAKTQGITLDAADEEKIKATVDAFMTREFVLEASGADQALVEKFLRENAIAVKVFNTLTADIDTTFDDSVIRHRDDGIFINAKTTDAEGNDLALSAEEQQSLVSDALTEAQAMFDEGKTFEEIAEAFTEDESVNVSAIGEFAISAADAEPDEDGHVTAFYKFAWEVPAGETQNAVLEVNEGTYYGYIVTCINDDDPEYRANAEAEVLSERQNDAFSAAYGAISAKYGKYHVYDTVWDNINIESIMYPNPLLTGLADFSALDPETAELLLEQTQAEAEETEAEETEAEETEAEETTAE